MVKIETVGKTFMFAGLGEEGCKEAALQIQAVKRPGFFLKGDFLMISGIFPLVDRPEMGELSSLSLYIITFI